MNQAVQFRLISLPIAIGIYLISIILHNMYFPITRAIIGPQEKTTRQAKLPWGEITVGLGDRLYKLLNGQNISYFVVKERLADDKEKRYFSILKTGEKLCFRKNLDSKSLETNYPKGPVFSSFLSSNKKACSNYLVKQKLTKKLIYKSGVVRNTLTEAGYAAGLNLKQVSQFKKIFSGTVNFSRDIRNGDRFSLIYEVFYLHGKLYKSGNIIAAQLKNHKKIKTALRYTDAKNHSGYYTLDGNSLETLFLEAPLKYKRISSYFSLNRYDPVLHVMHRHLGVDFAAPAGTPIQSIGDGKITYRGRKGGYGNAIVMRYGRKYKALYGHMLHFEKGQYVGKDVKKGEIIGYVGSTGWSTGPHLHFGIYYKGIPCNPLGMNFFVSESLPKSCLVDFHQKSSRLLAELKLHEGQASAIVNE